MQQKKKEIEQIYPFPRKKKDEVTQMVLKVYL